MTKHIMVDLETWGTSPGSDIRSIGAVVFDFDRDEQIIEAAGGIELPFDGTQHNALDDARHQALCVIEAYNKIRG